MKHDYLTVGSRRWCLSCDTFQRRHNGVWRDDEEMIGAWPAYDRTQPECPRRIAEALRQPDLFIEKPKPHKQEAFL